MGHGLAAEGRQLHDVEQGWTVLSCSGFHGTALCPSDAQPCSPLTISTGTCGLPQACAALSELQALGSGSTMVGLLP